MMAYRWMRAAALALVLAAGPALAQAPYDAGGFGDPFDRGEGGYDWREDEDAIVRRDGWRGRGGPGGSICVTSRGNCVVEPAPPNAPCRCMIPGFGSKRGGIAE